MFESFQAIITELKSFLVDLAYIMPVVLTLAHTMKTAVGALDAHAKASASKRDDVITGKLVTWVDWLDAIATTLAHIASAGYFARQPRTPAIERVEAEDEQNPIEPGA